MRAGVIDERSHALEALDLEIDPRALCSEHLCERDMISVEQPPDLGEREAEVAQGTDAREAAHVVLVVDALMTSPTRQRCRGVIDPSMRRRRYNLT